MYHPKADEEKRKEFHQQIEQYQHSGKTIVYVDESGFAHDMPRTHGYSERGKRCYAQKDWHAKGRTNAIGAIIDNKLLTVCLFDCNIDSDVFYAWLTKNLIPKLPEQSVVVMDNDTFHKRSDMMKDLKKQNLIPLYLPPYSPDLNPIEHKWAQAKPLRKRHHCSVSDLFKNPKMLC